METINAWRPPIPPADVIRLSRIIEESGGITSAIPELRSGDWETFATEQGVHGTQFLVHIDQNFMIALRDLKKQKPISAMRRRVAALMAFAIMFDMQIDPRIAMHEYAFTAKGEPSTHLAMFRFAYQNIHPQTYADFALDRISQLPVMSDLDLHQCLKEEPVPSSPVSGYAAHYTGILGMLAIHTDPKIGPMNLRGRKKRLLTFLKWMRDDFIFVACVTTLASHLWGKGQASKLLKYQDTRNAEKLLKSAKNTAWDFTLICNWAKMEKGRARQADAPITFLFTLDRGLAELATEHLMIDDLSLTARRRHNVRRLCKHWSDADAIKIADIEFEYESQKDDPSRKVRQPLWHEYVSSLPPQLEGRIRDNLSKPVG